MFAKSTISEITAAAREFGLEPAALLAIADVESGGIAFATIDDRPEPLIRFEGHYFDRRVPPGLQKKARDAGLASPKAGAIANPRTQSGRWRLLEKAVAIDRRAAYESVSWGLGQVMGSHWKMLGFASVEALVAEARSGARGQAMLIARYVTSANLDAALRRHDWPAFARGYNGPNYRENRYDTRIALAWRRYGNALGAAARAAPMPKLGSSGPEVEAIQTALVRHGFALTVDGLFGRATRRAVQTFQRRNALVDDGIVGPATRTKLEATAVKASNLRAAGWLRAVRSLWASQ